jgi:hypothetical protein
LVDNAGSEIRLLCQQAPLCKVPYHFAIVQGIVNDGDDVPQN